MPGPFMLFRGQPSYIRSRRGFHAMVTFGFSLIELLIVVAIIAVLGAIAIPQFTKYISKTRRAEMFVGLAGIYAVEAAYYANNSEYQVGSMNCGGAPATWDNNFSVGGFFNLSHPAKFYGFCIDVIGPTFTARAAGNIDNDATLDHGQVTDGNKVAVITIDDVATP